MENVFLRCIESFGAQLSYIWSLHSKNDVYTLGCEISWVTWTHKKCENMICWWRQAFLTGTSLPLCTLGRGNMTGILKWPNSNTIVHNNRKRVTSVMAEESLHVYMNYALKRWHVNNSFSQKGDIVPKRHFFIKMKTIILKVEQNECYKKKCF